MRIEKMFFKICKEISRDRVVTEERIKRIILSDIKLPIGKTWAIYVNKGYRFIKIHKNEEEKKIEITLNIRGYKNSDLPTQLLKLEIF